ncbi:MAG: hypothetical protein HC812_13735 [Leptolyngbya sp. RL_3_1]|nr:hypothetical protein [Leptolyngbya sp. RL_3_1]
MKDLACNHLAEIAQELERDAEAAPTDTAARLTQAVRHIRAAIALLQPPKSSDRT